MTTKNTKRVHLFDVTQCVGCSACMIACAQTNYPDLLFAENEHWQMLPTNIRKETAELAKRPVQMLVQCQECENAPCVTVCPVKANYRDEFGRVKTDPKKCIHCGACVAGCPYDARWMHPKTNVPVKCMGEGCEALVAQGLPPACVAACPVHARSFGDVSDPKSEIARRIAASKTAQYLPEKGTKPTLVLVVGKKA